MSGGVAITVFVVGVIVAIMIHEWGHFVTARMFGMRAERFFLGFGPTLVSYRAGETEYGVKALPLGGFVRIAGMTPTDERLPPVADAVFDPDAVADDRRQSAEAGVDESVEQPAMSPRTWQRLEDELRRRGVAGHTRQDLVTRTRAAAGPDASPEECRRAFEGVATTTLTGDGPRGLRHRVLRGDEGRFYGDRPAWQRAIVLVAGSVMHFVQALVLLFVAYLAFGALDTVPVVESVGSGTPAAAADLQPGDRIVAVAGQDVETFDDAREILRARPERDTPIRIVRDGSEMTVTATLESVEDEATGEAIDRKSVV